jgi:ABC-type branched-subunit amino acid transport system ATPase component
VTTFGVPEELLRTADDTAAGPRDGAALDPRVDAVRLRVGPLVGMPAALCLAALLGFATAPIPGVIAVGLSVVLFVVVVIDAKRQAAWEERALLESLGESPEAALAPVPASGLIATATRLTRRRGIRDLLVAVIAVGATAFAVPLFGRRVLVRNENAPHDAHSALLIAAVVGIVAGVVLAQGVMLGAKRAPARDVERIAAGLGVALGTSLIGLAMTPPFGRSGTTALLGLGEAVLVAAAILAGRCLIGSTAGHERPAAWLLVLTYALVVGGLVGTIVLDLIASSRSPAFAMRFLVGVGVVCGGWLTFQARAATTADEARDVVLAVVERRRAQERAESGVAAPALEVVDVDFSFGAQQVLRNVSLSVADGEIAALLGTNGAGKSTLLRVAAGLLEPDRGVVRLYGDATTAIGAEGLAENNVALVLGGGMTFPALTVAETLRLTQAGLSNPADLDEVYGRFPVLWHRRLARSGTLSGGEQQMLALGRALLCRPRIMLIDELTLGLAPKIVGELVELVRGLNEQGITVVLVEQSVNLATSLATHAFFLERGEVRYDGPTDELLGRDDLLRSVFLASAAT